MRNKPKYKNSSWGKHIEIPEKDSEILNANA